MSTRTQSFPPHPGNPRTCHRLLGVAERQYVVHMSHPLEGDEVETVPDMVMGGGGVNPGWAIDSAEWP